MLCHALTGNAHAAGILDAIEKDAFGTPDYLEKYSKMQIGKEGWWAPLIGPGKLFDTNKYFVICSNVLGSCYGTSGPISTNGTGNAYQADFPAVTVRDMVKLQKALSDHLGIEKYRYIVGGSLGGMQALEWAVMYPDSYESIITIATAARHSDWAISINEAARNAIINDPDYNNGYYSAHPTKGLALARKIAMISYRSAFSFNSRFDRERTSENHYDSDNKFQVENFLNYNGEKLVKRFDANSYMYLSKAMDLHDISYGRESLQKVLQNIEAPLLSIGINSDILYTADEQFELAAMVKNGIYREIDSPHGHDAFLIEFDQLKELIAPFLDKIDEKF